mmetsp:Transcript_143495/g.458837  ORF Transcript_143495/g.458837 Transcript_143495/m.458837 type:complete len:94 (-) Transcript_143495:131-412(-)
MGVRSASHKQRKHRNRHRRSNRQHSLKSFKRHARAPLPDGIKIYYNRGTSAYSGRSGSRYPAGTNSSVGMYGGHAGAILKAYDAIFNHGHVAL